MLLLLLLVSCCCCCCCSVFALLLVVVVVAAAAAAVVVAVSMFAKVGENDIYNSCGQSKPNLVGNASIQHDRRVRVLRLGVGLQEDKRRLLNEEQPDRGGGKNMHGSCQSKPCFSPEEHAPTQTETAAAAAAACPGTRYSLSLSLTHHTRFGVEPEIQRSILNGRLPCMCVAWTKAANGGW